MPFPDNVRLEAMIACQRCCCLCHQRKHTRMVCHHIVPQAQGGPDTQENCIPLCPDCHSEVESFNSQHYSGQTKYSPQELVRRRDDWYARIEQRSTELAHNLRRSELLYPHNPALQGRASFNYSHHDGYYRLGGGNSEFLTHWSKSSDTSIVCYTDGTNVSIALPPKNSRLQDITNASRLDYSSRVRILWTDQFVVLKNYGGRYAALHARRIEDDSRNNAEEDLLVFDYWILEDGSDDFSQV